MAYYKKKTGFLSRFFKGFLSFPGLRCGSFENGIKSTFIFTSIAVIWGIESLLWSVTATIFLWEWREEGYKEAYVFLEEIFMQSLY